MSLAPWYVILQYVVKIPKHNIQSNEPKHPVRYNITLTSRMCTPSACAATVTWSSELDFLKTVAYTPGFLGRFLPRIVDVYVVRRKGSLIFDLFIARS